MWFTERNANMIGRISGTTPGATTEFPLAGGATSPDLIVVGPDGALWYTQSNSVGRMPPANPAGVQTFGGIGIIQARGIAVGPDGNLWVADAGGNQVIRVSPAGAAVGSPIALPLGFNARGITRGPDGNMWVGQLQHPRLGRPHHHGRHAGARPAGRFPGPGWIADRRDRRQRRQRLVRGPGHHRRQGHAGRNRHSVHEQGSRSVRRHARPGRRRLVRRVPGERGRPRGHGWHHQRGHRHDRAAQVRATSPPGPATRSGSPRRPATGSVG